MSTCTCPTECDCQNPDGVGIAHVSEHCPEHNTLPWPYPDCIPCNEERARRWE